MSKMKVEGHTETRQMKFVDWQPGNGYRYMLLFVEMPPEVCKSIGAQEGSWLVSRMNSAPCPTAVVDISAPLAPAGVIHWTYIMEKMKCSKMDASEIARVVGKVLGRQAACCTDDTGHLLEGQESA